LFKNKVLLITGGTGSFGNAVLRRFLHSELAEIRIYSRDEKKQEDMRKNYAHPKIRFYLGDVRDFGSVREAVRGVDYIFHAAALKQVPSCEFHPMQAVRTNVFGTDNVLSAAVEAQVGRVICLSTDKAVYPINAMGMSKALMEKLMVAKSRNLEGSGTIICGTRYGNVMASRGSVIPLFVRQVLEGHPITVTDPRMTRFMMSLESAVELVLHAFQNGSNGDMFVQKAPACSVGDIAAAVPELLRKQGHPVQVIGTRHGEKLYETLLTREEMAEAEDQGHYYRIPPDLRDLNYDKYFDEGEESISETLDYTSHNARRLSREETKELLMTLPYIQQVVGGEAADPDI
jgi:UDP-glucose 4-epimerase